MSREEAAAKASYAFMENSTPEMFFADTELARQAYLDDTKVQLAAADAHDAAHGIHRVAIDDATVERAARQLLKFSRPNHCDWDEWTPSGQRGWKDQARAVLAAAVEAGQ